MNAGPSVRTYGDFDQYFQDRPDWTISHVFQRVSVLVERHGLGVSEAHRQAHIEGPPPKPKQWGISIFDSVLDKNGRTVHADADSLEQLFNAFYSMPSASKLHSRSWSPATFNGTRAAKNVIEVSALVFDFDDGTTIDQARSTFIQIPHYGHTSWSHTEEDHRFRVVIPLHKPIPGRVWKQVYQWALQLWEETKPTGAGSPDRACSDPSRLYLVPVYRRGYARFSWFNKPPWYDAAACYVDIPEEVQREKPPPPKPKRIKREVGSGQLERAARKRAKIDPQTRENIAHAIGAKVRDQMARGIRCPQCARPSVWYGIQGEQSTTAKCNHVNTCGWWGSVYDLAIQNGMTL